jgi:tetratricopeptide (TPR) repeat protein
VLRTDSVLPGLAAGLAGYGIALLFHFTGPGHTPLAALFAGALLAVPCAVPTRPALSMARSGSLAAAVVAVGAALGAVAEVPLRQAVVALAAGDAASAEESFSTAQALRWWDPAVAVTAGHAYRVAATASGDDAVLQRAEHWLTTGGDRTSRPVSVLVDLGAVREARGELPAAAEALDAALDREPAHPESLLLRGVVAARQEDYDLAERLFRAAARSDPDSPAPWDNLARVYRATGRPADARAAEAESAGLR